MSMGQIVELDPRVVPLEKKLKMVGVAVVAVAASGVVIVGGLSIIAAAGVGLAALAAVNLGIPLGARQIALWKQKGLTALAENYSEETIREDERQEGDRLAAQQSLYQKQEAEFGSVVEELRSNLSTASPEERELLQGQIDELIRILGEAKSAVQQKAADLVELRRINKIYIGFQKASQAMKGAKELARNAEQIQRVETARNAIKTRMREAVAGQKLEAMNAPLQVRLSVSQVAQIATSPIQTSQLITNKEENHVPIRR